MTSPTTGAPRKLGDYVLLEELGRGGMGVVYRAQHERSGRIVALKVLPSFAGMDKEAVARFRNEAEAARRLEHAGIVPIHAIGEQDGVHWFAMELIGGPSLHRLLQTLSGRAPDRLLGTIAEETALDLVFPALQLHPDTVIPGGSRYAYSCSALAAAVAEALDAAHRGKVVHRDVKPSNIMIAPSGQPVLLDFGLARDELSIGLTRSGDAVGTPAYMAPEQARGDKAIDARADVYGLGATLYEMLTLRPPFEGAYAGDIMRRILDEDPTPVRRLNPRVPVALETIVHKCLAKAPDQRYATAEGLALDLRAFLAGRPIAARRPSALLRAWNWYLRNRTAAVVAIGSVLLTILLGTAAGVVSSRRAREEGRDALARALAAIERGELGAAQESYGRAEALLGADEVADARLAQLRDVFPRQYAAGSFALLGELIADLPERRRAECAELVERLAGRGTLVLRDQHGRDVENEAIELQPVAGGRIDGRWRRWRGGEPLPIGSWLVRVRRPDHEPIVTACVIARDRKTQLTVHPRPLGTVREDRVLIPGARLGEDFLIARHELSEAQYDQLVAAIDDPALRAEMALRASDRAAARDLPVSRLSPWQARLAAALSGGHLPSQQEFVRAATLDLPELRYPWGAELDPAKVAADRDQMVEPLPVHSLPAGASASGVQHLVGNVAEILAIDARGSWSAAGGHYLSHPHELGVRELREIPLLEPSANTGMRLAWFLPPPDDRIAAAAVAEQWEQMRSQAGAAVRSDWQLGEDGRIRATWILCGVLTHGEPTLVIPLAVPGHQLAAEPIVEDGHGRRLPATMRAEFHREHGEITVDLGARARTGSRYQLSLSLLLQPAGGLRGAGDAYYLEQPIKLSGRLPSMHTVELPAGCRVDTVEPPPAHVYAQDGRTTVVWTHAADDGGLRTVPGVVRFRRDGLLTARWPARAPADEFVRRMLAALSGGGGDVRDAIDPTYRQLPTELGRDDALAQPPQAREQFDDWRLTDVTAIGRMIQVDGLVRWSTPVEGRSRIVIEDWPLRLCIRRDDDGWKLVRLLPAGRADTGTLSGGTYSHPGLKLELTPPAGTPIVRTRDELTELQVRCIKPDDEDVSFHVVGTIGEVGVLAEVMETRLTRGALAVGTGRRLDGEHPAEFGPEEQRRRSYVTREWQFSRVGRGEYARERWSFVQCGVRWFLVRAVARGDHGEAARQRFAGAEDWFRAMAAGLRIQ